MQQEYAKPDIVLKLYNDKVTLSKFVEPKVKFRYHDLYYKRDVDTNYLYNWTYEDTVRRIKSFGSSLARSRRIITELSDKNKFAYFLTVTFNKKYVNRKNAEDIHKKFKNIVKRLKYHFDGVEYVQVAEFHEDAESIHYHSMINFARKPEIRYVGVSKRGHDMFHITTKFKKYDCFLTLEKLKENNLHYLIKYMTKGYEFPLCRKFGCTRGLNRSRLEDKVYLRDDMRFLETVALQCDFRLWHKSSKRATFVYATCGGCAAGAPRTDLLYIDTKDENCSKVFMEFLQRLQKFRKRKAFGVKIFAEKSFFGVRCKKLLGQQLHFDFETL